MKKINIQKSCVKRQMSLASAATATAGVWHKSNSHARLTLHSLRRASTSGTRQDHQRTMRRMFDRSLERKSVLLELTISCLDLASVFLAKTSADSSFHVRFPARAHPSLSWNAKAWQSGEQQAWRQASSVRAGGYGARPPQWNFTTWALQNSGLANRKTYVRSVLFDPPSCVSVRHNATSAYATIAHYCAQRGLESTSRMSRSTAVQRLELPWRPEVPVIHANLITGDEQAIGVELETTTGRNPFRRQLTREPMVRKGKAVK